MLRATFLTAAMLAGLSGAALAGGDCGWGHSISAGDYTPAPVADASNSTDAPAPLLPLDNSAATTDEG